MVVDSKFSQTEIPIRVTFWKVSLMGEEFTLGLMAKFTMASGKTE
jgi:hypothetical protein